MIMRENAHGRAAESRTIDQRSMRQFIEENNIALARDGTEGPNGSGITAAEGERRRHALPFRDCALQLHMRRLRARDQTRGTRTHTKIIERVLCCLAQSLVGGQAEIIIRSEVDEMFADKINARPLSGPNFA